MRLCAFFSLDTMPCEYDTFCSYPQSQTINQARAMFATRAKMKVDKVFGNAIADWMSKTKITNMCMERMLVVECFD